MKAAHKDVGEINSTGGTFSPGTHGRVSLSILTTSFRLAKKNFIQHDQH